MHKIIKISDLWLILSHYCAKFIQDEIEAGELNARFGLRVGRRTADAEPMGALLDLYNSVKAANRTWLTNDEVRQYASIMTSEKLHSCPDLFEQEWTLPNLAKLNRVLKYFAECDALTDGVLEHLEDQANRDLVIELSPILEHTWYYQYAISKPTLTDEQYVFLFENHDCAYALAICFGMFALHGKDDAAALNQMLFEAIQKSEDLRAHMQAINNNCDERMPWQNIPDGQPLTRAIDTFRNQAITPRILQLFLDNLPNCEQLARKLQTKKREAEKQPLTLQSNAAVFSHVNNLPRDTASQKPSGMQFNK